MLLLLNTLATGVTSTFLWFALTFWVYLQTRNVIATGVVGGAYMLLVSMSSIVFGFAFFRPTDWPYMSVMTIEDSAARSESAVDDSEPMIMMKASGTTTLTPSSGAPGSKRYASDLPTPARCRQYAPRSRRTKRSNGSSRGSRSSILTVR